ncbi:unnamed protein product [Darwinula stevensoni]|uniref:Uncharacterized protein n=1 Tax=Darwinula stevensoni TaxID=69355 RepID=A0A7R9FQK4_9CRUS|nr:unnamed protein product [Darwinula stevensoni]CAG0899963.1 unnamed protein product [Darwinula stevensoni]
MPRIYDSQTGVSVEKPLTFQTWVVVTILGTFLPGTLPDWDLEPICGWGKIGESFLLPLLLLALDPRLKQALQHTFSRRHSKDHLASATRFHDPNTVEGLEVKGGKAFSHLIEEVKEDCD